MRGKNRNVRAVTLEGKGLLTLKDYPYPGEYVIVVEYFGTKFYTQKWEARIYLSLDQTTTILEYDCTVREHLKPIK